MSRKFGIDGLDRLLGGGFDESSSIGILGEPGTDRDLFNHIFTETGVKNNEPTIYFCSNNRPMFLRQDFEKREINESECLEIVDCYSWKLGKPDSSEDLVMGSSNLNEFLNLYNKARKKIGNDGRSVIDSIINIVDFEDLSAINNVLQILFAEEQNSNNSLLISISSDYRKKIINLIESYVSGFIELKRLRGNKYIKVHWMSNNDYKERWHQYSIEKGVSKNSALRVIIGDEVGDELNIELTKKSGLI
ncbi:hypothetical protein C9439_05635 [archaeon SCG-AAA382B04]|nr:hypothetical protein C9439_05635 [archaeon SCG-AAA382B04]